MKRRPKLERKKTMLMYGQEVQLITPIFTTYSVEQLEAHCDYLEEEVLRLQRDKVSLKDDISMLKLSLIQVEEGGMLDRENLEWLVGECLKDAFISVDRGRELLGFKYMEQMREWLDKEQSK